MISGPLLASDMEFYLSLYSSGCTRNPPWGTETFDCFVINRSRRLQEECVNQLARELASARTDWIETFGPMAESLHDAIDLASVQVARQTAVGDGSPMTAWHEDIASDRALAEYLSTGGHGFQSVKFVAVLGEAHDENKLRGALNLCLAQDYPPEGGNPAES